MIGVDANVLLRHILVDDPVWSERSNSEAGAVPTYAIDKKALKRPPFTILP
jgi:predicted nucleic-acid-binding protein